MTGVREMFDRIAPRYDLANRVTGRRADLPVEARAVLEQQISGRPARHRISF